MKSFKYADENIRDLDLMIAVTSNILAVLVLSMPRLIASKTVSSDGWIGILLGGLIACLFSWMVAKLVSKFPNQSFFSFSTDLLKKPVAIIVTLLFVLQYTIISAFQVREIAELSQQYLFDRTPIDVIALTFLLVVVYGASGSRAGIFRLNILFMPLVIVVVFFLLIFSLGFVELNNIFPVFQTDIQGYLQASTLSFQAFLGFGIVLFYISLVENPKNTPKRTALGVTWAMILYLLIYIICIGTFGNITTSNLFFPTLEVSKAIEIPGGFFERFDSIFFTIWTMAVFTTCLMAFDVAVMLFHLIFSKMKKINIVLIFSPIIYLLSMLPKNYIELVKITKIVNPLIAAYLFIVFVILTFAYKIKGVKHVG